jgi:hypothetical protein
MLTQKWKRNKSLVQHQSMYIKMPSIIYMSELRT